LGKNLGIVFAWQITSDVKKLRKTETVRTCSVSFLLFLLSLATIKYSLPLLVILLEEKYYFKKQKAGCTDPVGTVVNEPDCYPSHLFFAGYNMQHLEFSYKSDISPTHFCTVCNISVKK
jgi:hypothetical protein